MLEILHNAVKVKLSPVLYLSALCTRFREWHCNINSELSPYMEVNVWIALLNCCRKHGRP